MGKYKGIKKYASGLGDHKVKTMGESKPVGMWQTDPETGIQYEIDPNTLQRTGKTIAPPADSTPAAPKDTRWKPNATRVNRKGERVPTRATKQYRKKHDIEPMKVPQYKDGVKTGKGSMKAGNAMSTVGGIAQGIGALTSLYGAAADDPEAAKYGAAIGGGGAALSTTGAAFSEKGKSQENMIARYGMRYQGKKKKK